jgi:hypothetical protein
MAGTGLLLKYTSLASKYLPFVDLGLTRYIHNNLSVLFTIVLVIMALSGIVMYFYPWYVKRRQNKTEFV